MDLEFQNPDPDDLDNPSSEEEEEETEQLNNPTVHICDLCGSTYQTDRAYQTHIKQKHHINYVSKRQCCQQPI